MKEPNCFPPAEYNPSSLTPTSLSQSLMAMHELLYLRPQLSLPVPSGSWEICCSTCCSSTSHHIHYLLLKSSLFSHLCPFACMLLTNITGTCMFSQKTPSFFTLCQGTTPRPTLLVVQQLSGISSPSGGPKLALPESLHSLHRVMFPLGHSSPRKTMGSSQPLRLSVVKDSGALTHVAKALLWEI